MILSKRCTINFFWKTDDYFKDRAITYKKYKNKIEVNCRRSITFFQDPKVDIYL